MKRLFSLLCLLLCVCICLPAFLVSASAQEVDGNTVLTHWYIDNVEDLILFENTITSRTAPSTFYIYANIILSNPIQANTLFNLNVGLEYDLFAEYPVQVSFYDSGSTFVTSTQVDITNNAVIINNLQFDSEIAKIILKFNVYYPSWTVVNTVYDVLIDGNKYTYEDEQTWSAWCQSNYNTLGLYVDNGYIYDADLKQLQCNGVAVPSYAYPDKDKSYALISLAPAVTYINFTIGGIAYQAESGMTWAQWLSSEYNTGGFIPYPSNTSMISTSDESQIILSTLITSQILSDGVYNLANLVNTLTFYANGKYYDFEEGMTWQDYIDSEYNTTGFTSKTVGSTIRVYDGDGAICYRMDTTIKPDLLPIHSSINTVVVGDIILPLNSVTSSGYTCYNYYGTREHLQAIKDGEIVVSSTSTSYVAVRYEYDFRITSVNVTVQDEGGLLNGIISWLKKVVDTITGLPSKIGDMIKGLFVPSEEELESIFDKFEALLKDRFGIAYDAIDIIGDFESAFKYSEGQSKVSFPSVTVNLAGTEFTFGGWDVNLIPVGFEGLVDALKLIVNLVSTIAFVFAVKHRYEEILRR